MIESEYSVLISLKMGDESLYWSEESNSWVGDMNDATNFSGKSVFQRGRVLKRVKNQMGEGYNPEFKKFLVITQCDLDLSPELTVSRPLDISVHAILFAGVITFVTVFGSCLLLYFLF